MLVVPLVQYKGDLFKSHTHPVDEISTTPAGDFYGSCDKGIRYINPNGKWCNRWNRNTRPRNIALLACIKY